MKLPSEEECMQYFEEYKVPRNILAHCKQTRNVAVFLAKQLIQKGIILNLELIDRASLLHDLFKVVDIDNLVENKGHSYVASEEEIKMWKHLKEIYSGMHEDEVFEKIFAKDFPELAQLITESGGLEHFGKSYSAKLVHYADARVLRDEIVTRKEREEYLFERYPERKEIILKENLGLDDDEKEMFFHLDFKPEELAERMKNG
jgi:HD superfamily phosphodiesterase